jgi:hypothetical protein
MNCDCSWTKVKWGKAIDVGTRETLVFKYEGITAGFEKGMD